VEHNRVRRCAGNAAPRSIAAGALRTKIMFSVICIDDIGGNIFGDYGTRRYIT
jgi:hypothetical protein